jgi:hypothetical protein
VMGMNKVAFHSNSGKWQRPRHHES